MTNEIKIFKKNTRTVPFAVTGLSSLSGYTAVLTCKKSRNDTAELFHIDGSIVDLVINFTLSSSNTDREEGEYYYDVTITNGTNIFTLTVAKLIIVDSVIY